MTTATNLRQRLDRIEAKRGRPALVIDAVVIGGAPIDGAVIVIGGALPTDWRRPVAKPESPN